MSAAKASDFHPATRLYFARRDVLVIGGSGFIGSHVVEQLLALDAQPIVLSRQQAPAFLSGVRHRIELVVGDALDRALVRALVRRAPTVLNIAARVAGIEHNKVHPASMFMDNMEVYFSVLRAAVEGGAKRLLVTSSACVYPRECSIPTPESEGSHGEPEPTNRGYGWAKRMEEMLAQAASVEYGIQVAVARPYNAYGPRDNFDPARSHVIPALIRKALAAGKGEFAVWGDGSHSRSFLFVDDFVRGLLEVAARHPVAEPINLGTAEEVTIRQLAGGIAEAVERATGHRPVPRFDPAGITGQPRRCCDTSLAERVLGYRAQTQLQDGLDRTIDWYLMQANNASLTAT